MEELSRRLAQMTMNDDYRPYMLAIRNFVRYHPLLVAMAQSSMFLPSSDIEAPHIEKQSLLGPFFAISPLQGEVAMNYFSSPTTRDKAYINNSQRSLRLALQTHQDELFDIANCFIKVKDSRERILDWFALTLNANHKRRAMRVDPRSTSSDAFMVNITVILDRLCEPFMDAAFTKIDRIDINYLRRSPRLSIKDETKINADQQTSDDFYSTTVGGTNNFITEIFFLTVASHHYGLEAANTKLSELQKDLKWLEKQLAQMETERLEPNIPVDFLKVHANHVQTQIRDECSATPCLRHPCEQTQGSCRERPLRGSCYSGRTSRRNPPSPIYAIHALCNRMVSCTHQIPPCLCSLYSPGCSAWFPPRPSSLEAHSSFLCNLNNRRLSNVCLSISSRTFVTTSSS